MNDTLITHIMPVTFFGGTGGNFLRSLLTNSKFTGLEKFSLNKLLLWRELTLKGISDMDQRTR
jgi:hypothetical protein